MLETKASNGVTGYVSSELPATLQKRLAKMLLDKETGNFRINVKDGRILGFHVEEIHSLSPVKR